MNNSEPPESFEQEIGTDGLTTETTFLTKAATAAASQSPVESLLELFRRETATMPLMEAMNEVSETCKKLSENDQMLEFNILYSRLLWTCEICKDLRISKLTDAELESLPMLPTEADPNNPHSVHRKWLAEYAYFGHSKLPESNQSPTLLGLLSQVIWGVDEAEPEKIPPTMFAIDQGYVMRALTAIADQIKSGNEPMAEWKHLSLTRDFNFIQLMSEGGEGLIAKVKPIHFSGYRVVKVPLPQVYKKNESPRFIVRLIREARMIERVNERFPDIQVVRVRSVKGPIIEGESLSDEEINARLRLHLSQNPIYAEYDYYPDGDLEDSLKGNQPLDAKFVAGIARQIAVILSKVHQIPIQHRDLKPRNLLRKGDLYYLSDFGMAVEGEARVGEGNRYGTRYYMSPEQFERDVNLTTRVDIWAFGVILYRMLSGKLPFTGSKTSDIEKKIKQGSFEALATVDPSCPKELDQLVNRCINLISSQRPGASEIVTDLSNWLQMEGISSDNPSWHAWHPTVIARLTQKRCVFILVELTTSDASVHEAIKRMLVSYDCTVFRIYRILGEYDCLIRAYMTYESLELFQADVHNQLPSIRPIERIIVCSVKGILNHWYWSAEYFQSDQLQDFDTDTAAALEPQLGKHSWEYSPDFQKQINRGIIRRIHENSDKKIFFIFVKQSNRAGAREQLLKQVHKILDVFLRETNSRDQNDSKHAKNPTDIAFLNHEKGKKICHVAEYELWREPYFFLIKAEVEDFFVIGELVAKLMEELAASGCMTMTCVAADRFVLGREALKLENRAVNPVTQMLAQELPKLVAQWRREPSSGGSVDETQLRFAGEILLRIQYTVKRPFYKAVRPLLELMLMYRLHGTPIVQLFGRILLNVSIAAQEAIGQMEIDRPGQSTKALLLEIKKGLITLTKDKDSPWARILSNLHFDELDSLAKYARVDAPDNKMAENESSIEKLILFLEKVYKLEEAFASQFDGNRPFTDYKSFGVS